MAAPKAPSSAAPEITHAPRPSPPSAATSPHFSPSVANLRKTLNSAPRPISSASTSRIPPPIGKKPPPPPGSRKPSTSMMHPPTSAPHPPSLPPPVSAPAPPPPVASAPPPPAPPPTPPSTLRPPPSAPSRSPAPPPPPPTSTPSTNGLTPSLAVQAAIRAAGQASPASAPAPPPPPPTASPPAPSFSAPPPPPSAPSPPISRQQPQQPVRSMLDSSSYTLAPTNGTGSRQPSPQPSSGQLNSSAGKAVYIHDPRWKFQDESMLPKPREFVGGPKRYRAGRGSSVPLDLSALQ
ncbi:MAG: hypothetical protein M1818_006677 [Claussenomyces sp. TS43310]|nr:MAG: hypothetical protein M1818_006891 [Claussenomyces sp. TS43310]KAI9735099.1 MAG: hypothetical protein M1818_006677 [Claussenomyces sp. TS43310]